MMTLPFDLDNVRRTPSMYIARVEFDTVAAYIQGLDAATYYSLLLGFQEWLAPKHNVGTELAWTEIILESVFPGIAAERITGTHSQLQQDSDHAKAIECLFRNLEEFWEEKSTPSGMQAIYLRFNEWLKQQEWYDSEEG